MGSVRITARFPLGVYHAQSQVSFDEPEWPPHPVRLIGALTAAAHSHGRATGDGGTLELDLALIRLLCERPPPVIGAPASVAIGEDTPTGDEAVRLTGATRWAPRNYFGSKKTLRDQARVHKVGVAVGDRSIQFEWPGLELDAPDRNRLGALLGDVSFLGTTRSPVVAELADDDDTPLNPAWFPFRPSEARRLETVGVRVPDPTTPAAFDRRHGARRSSTPRVEAATAAIPGIQIGRSVEYAHSSSVLAPLERVDPRWWDDMVVLVIDSDKSEVTPRSAATYLLARAVRAALLSSYGEPGTESDAPPILRGRGADAHCAILPLADVWHNLRGLIKGVAVLMPSDRRVVGLARQRATVERGLASLVGDTGRVPQRYVQIPGAGRVWLRQPTNAEATLRTLRKDTYRATARSWVSVSPVVHARWRKGESAEDQVGLDCSHVGLPAPVRVEPLRGAAFPGAASRCVAAARVPQSWRKSLEGPSTHLRLTFDAPVTGPVILGRARHFGLGLFVPAPAALTDETPPEETG